MCVMKGQIKTHFSFLSILSLFQLFIFVLYCSNRWHIKNKFTFGELRTVQLSLTIQNDYVNNFLLEEYL